jgi:hypothetical protein
VSCPVRRCVLAWIAERGTQSVQECLGLFDGWIVGAVLDHMERPSETGMGRFTDLGRTMTWKIGRDYAMRGHELRDYPHPVCRITSGAMQQDEWRAAAAFQHGRRQAMDVYSSFSDRESR